MRTTKHKLGYRLVLCLVVLLFLVTRLTNKNSGLVLVIIDKPLKVIEADHLRPVLCHFRKIKALADVDKVKDILLET